MKDTPQDILDIQREIIHSKTDEERSLMGAEMVDSVYEMIRSRIKEEGPELSEKEVTAKVFLRYYQKEFSNKQKEQIAAFLINTK
ncbi:MAG: hypothetical protein MK198_04245 [Gracilimonas sp.]|uniref:hypothetical protein n=1 Tax=Gracilimonas sp. TaxID=1974203 RepID=UPI003750E485|nr:hypothetical protein [Gracilimonas sp.]